MQPLPAALADGGSTWAALPPIEVLAAGSTGVTWGVDYADVHVLSGLTGVDEHVEGMPTVRRTVSKRQLHVLFATALRK